MSARRHIAGLASLPEFADDAAIGAALLGPDRACEWKAIVALYERRGFPKIDAIMGGRYVRAIRLFFDIENGVVSRGAALAPDGIERPEAWISSKRRA